jgi:hypothetical protein
MGKVADLHIVSSEGRGYEQGIVTHDFVTGALGHFAKTGKSDKINIIRMNPERIYDR